MTITINLETTIQFLQVIFYSLASLIILQFIVIGIKVKRITTRLDRLSNLSKWRKNLNCLGLFKTKKD